jgi:3-hydroxyisobutyrate dehydrogenase-like beta-hydroxyacid dehydrogenase
MKLGFIGTGHMGNPMVRKLMGAGHELVVNDRRQEATANLIELGATWADSPAAVAAETDILFPSLPGPAEVDEAALGENGILQGAREGTIHVDLTSSLPSSVRRLSRIARSKGVVYLEAPVSDMVSGAIGVEEERLTVFVGGEEAVLERVRPMLATFCKHIFHTGEVGSGNVIKLTNNMISLGSSVLIQEALAVGVKAGVDPQKLYEMWNVSSASRWVQGVPRMVESPPATREPTFTLLLSAKDVGCCLEMSRELGVPMTVGAAVSQVFTRTVARGLGAEGPGATLQTIEEEAGVRIRKHP